jgi:alkanesulfonate monooxygenase SsuD/methylene tetrahydromethanopterin reductase-like flavin-dependent oxidoreductase (luciferase family)
VARIQFGLQIPAETRNKASRATYVADVHHALTMAAGHFDSAWVVDHLHFGNEDVLESFTTLTYFAALHPQLKFGHNVLCQSFRNPALVAKMGATLQMLTGGRFSLGLGAGWHEEEYRAYGYDFPADGVRVTQLEETVQIIKGLWTQEQTTFTGRYYQVNQAYCEPKPDPIPPIMIGAFRPKMLRLTARYADEWNVSSTGPNKYRRMAQEFERACAEVGRDPATVRRSWCNGCAVAPTPAEAERLTDGRWSADNEDDFGFVGTPEQVVEQMRPFIDLDIDHFILDCGGFPQLTTLELLISEVLPALND